MQNTCKITRERFLITLSFLQQNVSSSHQRELLTFLRFTRSNLSFFFLFRFLLSMLFSGYLFLIFSFYFGFYFLLLFISLYSSTLFRLFFILSDLFFVHQMRNAKTTQISCMGISLIVTVVKQDMWSRGQEFKFWSSVLCSLALESFRGNHESITSPHRYELNSQVDRPLYFWVAVGQGK